MRGFGALCTRWSGLGFGVSDLEVSEKRGP